MKTKKLIAYQVAPYGFVCNIPKGTSVHEAFNLPLKNGKPQYWVKDWEGMTEFAESWSTSYGFLLSQEEVEA